MEYFVALLMHIACGCTSSLFSGGKKLGFLHPDSLCEISGLVASRANLGLLWVHNDSGNNPEIYLV